MILATAVVNFFEHWLNLLQLFPESPKLSGSVT